MVESSVQMLIDKQDLDDLVNTQMFSTDTRDWISYRRCFTDTVNFDLSDHVDRVSGEGSGIITDPDAWVETLKTVMPGFDASMHAVTNLVHDVKGDAAQSRCFVVGDHFLNNENGDRRLTVGTIATYGSVRTTQGWKIKTLHLKILYYSGNTSLYAMAAEKVSGVKRAPIISQP